jgi:hypothetical protein
MNIFSIVSSGWIFKLSNHFSHWNGAVSLHHDDSQGARRHVEAEHSDCPPSNHY